MPTERDIITDWLVRNLALKGRGARRALADFLGVRTQAISRMTNTAARGESRAISASELLRMADFFGVAPPLSAEDLSARQAAESYVIPIMGLVGAGAEVSPDDEQVPADGLEQVELPYPIDHTMIGFRVTGDSMAPTYEENCIVVVEREQPNATDGMIGLAAAVKAVGADGEARRYLKRIQKGSRAQLFNLESINDRSPTIRDVKVVWASPVRVIIPNIGIRRLPRKPGRGAKAGGRDARGR